MACGWCTLQKKQFMYYNILVLQLIKLLSLSWNLLNSTDRNVWGQTWDVDFSNLDAMKNRESAYKFKIFKIWFRFELQPKIAVVFYFYFLQHLSQILVLTFQMKMKVKWSGNKFIPVTKPLWALIIPVFTMPGCTALMVTLAFLACKIFQATLHQWTCKPLFITLSSSSWGFALNSLFILDSVAKDNGVWSC